MNKIQILIITFFFSSCTILIKLDESKNKVVIKSNEEQSFCPSNQYSKNSVIGNNKHLNNIFLNLLNKDKDFQKMKFIEKVVSLSILQTNVRPDASSPSAQFQSMIKINGKTEYLYSTSKDGGAPFYDALEQLLKKYKSKMSLLDIAKLMNNKIANSIPIDNEFANFLKMNKNKLSQFHKYKMTFFKADQVIQVGESVPKMNYEKIVRSYKRIKHNSISSNHLFKVKNHDNISCNFDYRIYSNSVYLLSPDLKLSKNPYGLQDRKGNVFLATTDLITDFNKIPKATNLFMAKSYQRPTAFCIVKNEKGHEMILSSFKGRDPGQFLYSLIKNNINSEKSLYEIEELLKKSRSLFLQNPKRLLLESKRASSQKVISVLEEKVPVYHVDKLGEIWLHTNFKIDNNTYNSGFIHDPRKKGVLACSK